MDFSDWIFATESEDIIRRIQEEAAQVVIDDLVRGEDQFYFLCATPDDKERPAKIAFVPFGTDEDTPTLYFNLDRIFPEKDVEDFTPDQLRYLIGILEPFVAECKAALG